jgi:hypothetical protein
MDAVPEILQGQQWLSRNGELCWVIGVLDPDHGSNRSDEWVNEVIVDNQRINWVRKDGTSHITKGVASPDDLVTLIGG